MIKANIAPESYNKGTDIEENLHFVVQGAMRSIWKSVQSPIVTPTVYSEIGQKHKHQQHSLNENFNMWYPLPRGKKCQKLSFFG